MTTSDLAATIRSVKAQVTIPVTYADVWEYWLRNREIYDAVDFVTIHILPYWEDLPIRAKYAAAHVDAIRKRMAVAFPAKEILIGETGWPSAGRMREAALPSRTNQARVVSEILDLRQAGKFPRQPDRGLRPALEASARGHGRRILGPDRFGAAGAEISAGPAHQQLSVLEAADGMRNGAEHPGVRRRFADVATPAMDAALAFLAGGRGVGDRGRDPARRGRRQDVLRKLRLRRLAAVGRAAGGRHGRAAAGGQCADVRPRAADVSRTCGSARGKNRDRS